MPVKFTAIVTRDAIRATDLVETQAGCYIHRFAKCRAEPSGLTGARCMSFVRDRIVWGFAFFLVFALSANASSGPTIALAVDTSEAPRKIIHARVRIPATPGTLVLYYPKWIPGEHAPDGPVIDLTGLKFSAGGKTLTWRRDLKDGWTINVDVPTEQNEVLADLDY